MRVWLALALLAGAGCKKTPDVDPEAEQRNAFLVKAEAEALAKLETKLKGLEGAKLPPRTTADGITLDGDWTSPWWVNEESLKAIASEPKGVVSDDVTKSHRCFTLIRNPDFGKRSISQMGDCQSGHYAFVIRTFERKAPVITEYGKAGQGGEFRAGTAHGDVVAFDLTTGKHVGGYRWQAQSDDVEEKMYLQRDFDRNVVDAVKHGETGFVKHP